jgi:hypothetical protein
MIIAPEAAAWAEHVATIFGPAAIAILHYGSRAQGRATRRDSAWDFFVVVSSYREAYMAAEASLGQRCHPRRAMRLAHVLPPNAISIRRPGTVEDVEAKCLVISRDDFARECSPRARDHFVQARISQHVCLAWARDQAGADAVMKAVRDARDHTMAWAPVFLPPSFDLDGFCRAVIAVPFAHELRAEGSGHPSVLFDAQRDMLREAYGPLLERGVRNGTLRQDGNSYRLARVPGWWRRFRVRGYFRHSKRRTSIRLLKHPLLYDDWVDYILRKIERHTGQRIELTPRERRHPLVFLWPRAIHFLWTRPQRRGTA